MTKVVFPHIEENRAARGLLATLPPRAKVAQTVKTTLGAAIVASFFPPLFLKGAPFKLSQAAALRRNVRPPRSDEPVSGGPTLCVIRFFNPAETT